MLVNLVHDYRDINRTQVARKKEAIAYFSIESALALLISLFINICVVSVFAKGFYGKEAGDIGLKNAGDYLGERFGSHMVSNIKASPLPDCLHYAHMFVVKVRHT